jgi:hypothetical protein
MNPRQTRETSSVHRDSFEVSIELSAGINNLKTLLPLGQEPECIKERDVSVPSLPEDQDRVSTGDQIENDRPDSFIVNAASYTGPCAGGTPLADVQPPGRPLSHDLLGDNSANGTKHHRRCLRELR